MHRQYTASAASYRLAVSFNIRHVRKEFTLSRAEPLS
jgi:hypothetical protein